MTAREIGQVIGVCRTVFESPTIPIDRNQPTTVSEVICVKCGHRWLAVRPEGTLLKHLECQCGLQGFVIETGQVLEG